ncbi:DUF2254 domain-containing protein [Pleomorphovibrio marinus]|uniref:DUF2254 domain-containing protein n=1 Tax=Pleomorphovibrio marinus TaxID=2164132 RepID=UPI0013003281|nr:DUF2254 domain-containing protein [Pleomorphovibrio marinus]
MKAKLIYIWELGTSSFWLLPLAISFSLGLVAVGLVTLDTQVDIDATGIWQFILPKGEDAARSVLSTVATAILGVAGTVFSITLVVLTLAASQFGSRLVQNFMDDRLNQLVLGLYTGTFIYCIIVLQTVRSDGEMNFIPKISIGFLLFLAILGIILLVYFIHHVSVNIQAEHVIAETSKRLDRSLKNLYPEKLGEDIHEGNWENNLRPFIESHPLKTSIGTTSTGYLQAIAFKELMGICTDNDLVVELVLKPGDFAVKDQHCMKVASYHSISDKVKEKLIKTLAFGPVRTSTQDAEFAFHQMVEIASRALSPGINDPFTAITCLDNLTAPLSRLAKLNFPSPFRSDKQGRLRVVTKPESFKGFLDASFNQIRQFGKGVPSVLIRLMENLCTLYEFADDSEKRAEIKRHAEMVWRTGNEFFTEKNDIEDLKVKFDYFE